MEIKKDEKTPISIYVHHSSQELHDIHNQLAALHREYEQTVNYFKAKVKNIVTQENARIAKINADAQHSAERQNNELDAEYRIQYNTAIEATKTKKAEFEEYRQKAIKEIASMRIQVDPRFQDVVDLFLPKTEETE
jgi:UDP-N-acetylmuramyl tripeptide synthase